MQKLCEKWLASAFALTLLISILIVAGTGCSDNRTSLGNSAESGNPEIAGILHFADGTPAAKVKVQLVPKNYSAADDEVLNAVWTSESDSLGQFAFENVPAEGFSLEANDPISGKKFLQMGLASTLDSSVLKVEGILENVGGVRLGAHGFEDGTTGYVYVPGTTILRQVIVEMGNIFVDSLPADSLSPFIFVADNGYSLSLDKGVKIIADSTIQIDPEKVALEFSFALTPKEIGLSEDLKNFPLTLRLDSNDFDAKILQKVSGSWSAILCGDTLPLDLSYSDGKNFTFWTRIPRLRAKATDTLSLHFAEDAKTSFADSTDRIFSDGFIAAWHFDEGKDSVRDATGNRFRGVPEKVTVSEDAAVGSAFYYDGKSGSVTIPNSRTGDLDFDTHAQRTFSVWVRLDSKERSRVVFGKGASNYHLMYLSSASTPPSGIWLYEAYSDLTGDSTAVSVRNWYTDSSVTVNEWTFITIAQGDSSTAMYVNDSLVTDSPRQGKNSTPRITDSLFVIGKLIYPADDPSDIVTHHFEGVIDELHVSRVTRSAAWIKASYANQNPKKKWPTLMKN